jgi:hypothetical protein
MKGQEFIIAIAVTDVKDVSKNVHLAHWLLLKAALDKSV